MTFRSDRLFVVVLVAVSLLAVVAGAPVCAQKSESSSSKQQSSSSQAYPQEKAPSLVDPAGPTVSLVPSEPVFLMAAALNTCGYDEGLEDRFRPGHIAVHFPGPLPDAPAGA